MRLLSWWSWPWPAPTQTLAESGACDHQEEIARLDQVINQLARENDLLREDLAAAERTARQDAVAYEARIDKLTSRLLRHGDHSLANLYRQQRNELLRTREVNRRLAERMHLMTQGVVTL